MSQGTQNVIRRDLFAVQKYQDVGSKAEYVIERIFRNYESANKYRKGEEAFKRQFPLMPIKIIHPNQAVVDMYVLCGNEIWE